MKCWVQHGRRLLGVVAIASTVMTGASPVTLAVASSAPSAAGTTGADWTDVPYPKGAETAASIAASYASGQVSWHVGMQLLPATDPASLTTVGLVLRCDGTVCRHLEPPEPAPTAGSTTRYVSVGGSGPDDVWIGGYRSSPANKPVLWHWDGDAWTELTVPANPGTDGATVYGLSSRTAGDVYVLVRTHRRSTVDGSLAFHLVTSPGPAWRRLPVDVPGCVSAPRDVYFSRDVSQLTVAGGELVQTGTCHEQLAQGPGRTIGYAAVGGAAAGGSSRLPAPHPTTPGSGQSRQALATRGSRCAVTSSCTATGAAWHRPGCPRSARASPLTTWTGWRCPTTTPPMPGWSVAPGAARRSGTTPQAAG